MQISYFTERPYRGLSEDAILKNKAYFAVPNELFDREQAANDYNYYLDEYCYAEELGFDAVALNEHHGNHWGKKLREINADHPLFLQIFVQYLPKSFYQEQDLL